LLFELNATNFYLEYAGEKDKRQVLEVIKENLRNPVKGSSWA
jgi:5-methyltetrahydropteroyltriglutamate--homocysteine methyltransferase